MFLQNAIGQVLWKTHAKGVIPTTLIPVSCCLIGRNPRKTTHLCSQHTSPQSTKLSGRNAVILSIVHFGGIFVQMLLCFT